MATPLPTTLRAAYRAERATATPRKTRTPLLAHLGRAAGRVVTHAARARSAALTLSGMGALDYAAFRLDQIAGIAAIGVSLLVLEWLTTDGDQ